MFIDIEKRHSENMINTSVVKGRSARGLFCYKIVWASQAQHTPMEMTHKIDVSWGLG